jgi:hypothetical protein
MLALPAMMLSPIWAHVWLGQGILPYCLSLANPAHSPLLKVNREG